MAQMDNATEKTDRKKDALGKIRAFLALILVGAVFTVPAVSAASFNLTVIEEVIDAFIGLIEPITDLIVAIVPLWFILQILAFIMGLMAVILAMVKFSKK